MSENAVIEYLRSVELFKLGFISLDDFLKSVKRYAPNAPIDEKAIKQQEVERLQQRLSNLEMQDQINRAIKMTIT